MKESLDIRKTSGVRDSDDFFQKEREWAFKEIGQVDIGEN